MRGCSLKSSQVFNVCIDLFEYVEMIIVVSISSIRKGLTIKRDIFFERQSPLYCWKCLLVEWWSRSLFQTRLFKARKVVLLIPAFLDRTEKLWRLVSLLRFGYGCVARCGTCLETANLRNLFWEYLNFGLQQLNVCIWHLRVTKRSASGFEGRALIFFGMAIKNWGLFWCFEAKSF